MNLFDFEDVIPHRILERGYDYWVQQRIELIHVVRQHYSFVVHGTEDYEVEVTLSGNDIMSTDCDCPYTRGRCKHEVAAYFYLQAEKLQSKRPDLEAKLKRMKKAELVQLILRLADTSDVYMRLEQAFDPIEESFAVVYEQVDRRFNRRFPISDIDYTMEDEFISFVEEQIQDVGLIQHHANRLKHGLAMLRVVFQYEFETMYEVCYEWTGSLERPVLGAINHLTGEANDAIFVELLQAMAPLNKRIWWMLHEEILKQLAFGMHDRLDFLHVYITRSLAVDVEEEEEEEELLKLLSVIETRMKKRNP